MDNEVDLKEVGSMNRVARQCVQKKGKKKGLHLIKKPCSN